MSFRPVTLPQPPPAWSGQLPLHYSTNPSRSPIVSLISCVFSHSKWWLCYIYQFLSLRLYRETKWKQPRRELCRFAYSMYEAVRAHRDKCVRLLHHITPKKFMPNNKRPESYLSWSQGFWFMMKFIPTRYQVQHLLSFFFLANVSVSYHQRIEETPQTSPSLRLAQILVV